jgi:hypothetical protein
MPLLSDTTWPAYLLEIFEEYYSEPWPQECYSTSYNILFSYCVTCPDPVPFMFGPSIQPLALKDLDSDNFILSLII